MRYQAVLLDLDGVLCHTDQFHYKAWKVIADRLNTEFTKNDNNRLRGVSRMESLEILLEKCPNNILDEEKIRLAEEKNDIYCGFLMTLTKNDTDKDILKMLSELKNMGIKLAVASSSKNAKLILKMLELDCFFDAVIDGKCISKSKPNPEVFIKAAQALNMKTENCIVVEDAEAGIDAAIAGGFSSAAVGDAKVCGKAKYNLESVQEIVGIIKNVV